MSSACLAQRLAHSKSATIIITVKCKLLDPVSFTFVSPQHLRCLHLEGSQYYGMKQLVIALIFQERN